MCERLSVGGVHRQNLGVTHITSFHIPLTRTQSCGHIKLQGGAAKGGLAIRQEVKEKDICQPIGICATYPTHSNWSKCRHVTQGSQSEFFPEIYIPKWSIRSPVLILRSLARVSLKLSVQPVPLHPVHRVRKEPNTCRESVPKY